MSFSIPFNLHICTIFRLDKDSDSDSDSLPQSFYVDDNSSLLNRLFTLCKCKQYALFFLCLQILQRKYVNSETLLEYKKNHNCSMKTKNDVISILYIFVWIFYIKDHIPSDGHPIIRHSLEGIRLK